MNLELDTFIYGWYAPPAGSYIPPVMAHLTQPGNYRWQVMSEDPNHEGHYILASAREGVEAFNPDNRISSAWLVQTTPYMRQHVYPDQNEAQFDPEAKEWDMDQADNPAPIADAMSDPAFKAKLLEIKSAIDVILKYL